MERKRTSYGTFELKRFIHLGISIALLIVNIAVLICYYKLNHLLFSHKVPFWVFFVTAVFIGIKVFMIVAFYTNNPLLIDATVFLCVIMLIFQFLWGLIATFSVVIHADNVAINSTAGFLNKEKVTMMKEFEKDNNCCFETTNDVMEPTVASILDGEKETPKNNSQVTTTPKIDSTTVNATEHRCKSCISVNKEKARDIAIFLSTGYILIFVMLTATLLMIIL